MPRPFAVMLELDIELLEALLRRIPLPSLPDNISLVVLALVLVIMPLLAPLK